MSGQDLPMFGHPLPADDASSASSAGQAESGQAIELSVSELANLLSSGEGAGSQEIAATDINTYDGHAALALDAAVLPAIDATLDLLTSSPDLFHIPALDLPMGGEDTSSS
jgi:hypothetical protein